MSTTTTPTPSLSTKAVAEWTKIFPKHVVEDYTSSVIFIKQLTAVALSTITYLKNIFPEDNYVTEYFGGVKLKILKQKCSNDCASFLTSALVGAFDSFEKKYLHKLVLCFYEDEGQGMKLIEYYMFEYSYKSEGVTLNIHSKNRNNVEKVQKCTFVNIRERTVRLIRACLAVMQTCTHDPSSSFDMSIRLYYNKDVPNDYQAPGFAAVYESEDQLIATEDQVIPLGSVETPYHTLASKCHFNDNLTPTNDLSSSVNLSPSVNLSTKVNLSQKDNLSLEANASQKTPLMTQMDTGDVTDTESQPGKVLCSRNRTDKDDKKRCTSPLTAKKRHLGSSPRPHR